MIKSLILSTLSSLSILSGVASSLVNSNLETKYNNLASDQFLKQKNSPNQQTSNDIPSHSSWNLILNSGSFSYLTKLVNQLKIDPDVSTTQISSAGNFSSSSELYPIKLQTLVNSFLTDLSWTHLIEVLDAKKPDSQVNGSTNNLNSLFPEFKSKLLSFNSNLELSIFTLIVWILSCVSLTGSALYCCSSFNNVDKKEKLKWLIYHLITQLPGWLFKYRGQFHKLKETKEISSTAPLFSSGNNAFSLSNLNYSIGNTEILKNVNLNLKKNEFYAIIGSNGAGKTTLLKHFGRLLIPSEGQLLLGSKDLYSLKDKDFWKKVAYIPQEISIPPDTPVYDFLMSSRFISMSRFRKASKLDHWKVLQAIKRCQLQHLRWSKMGDLSGGQRQKVILASILVKDAELILLDEPTTFLDMDNRNFLISFFKDLHDSGKTIIANLHKFSEVNRLATTVIAMKEGRVQKVDNKEKILNAPFLNSLYDLNLPKEKWNSLIWSSKLNY